MKLMNQPHFERIILLFIFAMLISTGCGAQMPVAGADGGTSGSYSGALHADYEDALDVTSQLALGLLRLEGTPDAVTEAQAAAQFPLWQALQGTVLQSSRERLAVTKQIEAMLTEAQGSAIVALHLTQADAQAWLQAQGGSMATGGLPGGGGGRGNGSGMGANLSEEERAAMRERFQSMTDEERAKLRAQFTQQQASGTGAGTGAAPASRVLLRAVTMLVAERSGQGQSFAAAIRPQQRPETGVAATATPAPAASPAVTPVAQVTLVPWQTPVPTPVPSATPEPAAAGASSAAPNVTAAADVVQTATQPGGAPSGEASALEWVPDTDPGPPLTVQVTTNYAEPNPLLEGGLIYNVGGFVTNPTDKAYTITAVHVTFFDADGFRGAFYPFPSKGGGRGAPSGEYIWHGALEADVTCTVLGPGQACPFVAEIAAQNMASFLVHVDADVAEWHEPVAVSLRDVAVTDTGVSYVRFSGTAVNDNPYPVKNVVISGLLLDADGQTVRLGTGVVPHIEAGGRANFTVYVEKQAYASYRMTVLAEQDAQQVREM